VDSTDHYSYLFLAKYVKARYRYYSVIKYVGSSVGIGIFFCLYVFPQTLKQCSYTSVI